MFVAALRDMSRSSSKGFENPSVAPMIELPTRSMSA